jgi:hypothetical protein
VIASITPPLAHAGHWTTTLLSLAPIVIAIALVAVQSVRGRRRGIQPPAPPPTRLARPGATRVTGTGD